MTDIEEQIQEALESTGVLRFPGDRFSLAAAVMPLVKRAQAEALREAAGALDASAAGLDPERGIDLSYINCTRIDAQELRRRADQFEKEAGA